MADEPQKSWDGVRELAPRFEVKDPRAAANWYQEILGWKCDFCQHIYAVIQAGQTAKVHLSRTDAQVKTGSAYVWVKDVDAVFARFAGKQVKVLAEPKTKSWGMREGEICDLDGNLLIIGSEAE